MSLSALLITSSAHSGLRATQKLPEGFRSAPPAVGRRSALRGEKASGWGYCRGTAISKKGAALCHGPVVPRAVQGCGPRFHAPSGRWQLERPELRDSTARRVLPHGTAPAVFAFPRCRSVSLPAVRLHTILTWTRRAEAVVLFSLQGSVISLRSVPCTVPNGPSSLLQAHGKPCAHRAEGWIFRSRSSSWIEMSAPAGDELSCVVS